MASGSNTWFKAKRAKLKAQDITRACGSNTRFSVGDNGAAGRAHSAPPKPINAPTGHAKVVVMASGVWDARSSLSINSLRQGGGKDSGARRGRAGVRNGMRGSGVVVQVVEPEWKIYRRV